MERLMRLEVILERSRRLMIWANHNGRNSEVYRRHLRHYKLVRAYDEAAEDMRYM